MYRLWLPRIDLDAKSIEKKHIEFFCRKKLEANNTPFKNELNNKKILWQSVYHKIFLEEELVCREPGKGSKGLFSLFITNFHKRKHKKKA